VTAFAAAPPWTWRSGAPQRRGRFSSNFSRWRLLPLELHSQGLSDVDRPADVKLYGQARRALEARKGPARRGIKERGYLEVRLVVDAAERLWWLPRKARMTELHAIPVIHSTVSTGNLKVNRERRPGSVPPSVTRRA